jgi:hypothetical protein
VIHIGRELDALERLEITLSQHVSDLE